MGAASPLPSPEDFACTWADVFQARDTLARRWYFRLGENIPLEEFQSLGNEIICKALARYDPQTCPVSFLAALKADLRRNLADVWHAEYRGHIRATGTRGTRRRRVRTWAEDHPSPYAPLEAAPDLPRDSQVEDRCTLAEVQHYLRTTFGPNMGELLLESMESKSDFRRWGLTRKAFRWRVGQIRQRLDRWAKQGPCPSG